MSVDQDGANDVFVALLRVQKLLVAAKHAAPRVHEAVDVSAYPVLYLVAGSPEPVRISELASTMHNDVSTVSRQVSTLVAGGLLVKTADPHDGRAMVVSLTDEGHAVLDHIRATRSTWFQGLLESWDDARAASFVTDLDELADALDANLRARGAALPPMPYAAAPGRGRTTDQTRKD